MSENKRSFFATIPGLVTGLAGLLTGIVGLVTVLIQLDVIGGDEETRSTGSTADAPAGGGAGGAPTTAEVGTFTVSPSTLNFGPADPKEKVVKVTNTSDSAKLTVEAPKVTGKDADRFTASRGDCSGPLAPNLSCNVRVTFAPSGPLRTYEATIQIQATGAPRAAEVKVTASSVLG
jgi:hypothetical protein